MLLRSGVKTTYQAFFNEAIKNEFATFHNKKKEFSLLLEIDECFKLMVNNLINPESFLPSLFLMRAHSAFRAAVRLSTSGQCPETFSLLRSCIENSLYALHIYKNPEKDEVWIKRHDNDKTLKEVKREFSYGNVSRTIESVDPTLAKTSSSLYERCIDFGAHPNEKALISSLEIKETDKGKEYRQIYLTGDTVYLAHALKSTAQIGCLSLAIFRHITKHRFDILGITDRVDKLRSIL